MRLRTLMIAAMLPLLLGVGFAFADGSFDFSAAEPEGLSDAQQRLDPTDDRETVLHQTASGEWVAIQVFTAQPLDEDIVTVEDLAARLSREEADAGVISEESQEERQQELVDQYDCMASALAALPEDEPVAVDRIREASDGCIE